MYSSNFRRRRKSNEQLTRKRQGSALVTLPSDNEILITRRFRRSGGTCIRRLDNSRHRQALVGRDRGEVIEAQIDLRIGGCWRWVMAANGGFEVVFSGEYPRSIVRSAWSRPRCSNSCLT